MSTAQRRLKSVVIERVGVNVDEKTMVCDFKWHMVSFNIVSSICHSQIIAVRRTFCLGLAAQTRVAFIHLVVVKPTQNVVL